MLVALKEVMKLRIGGAISLAALLASIWGEGVLTWYMGRF